MSETNRTTRNTAQSPTSLSIEALEEIVRNCQRNEERLHELERHTRHERKKAERLLRETYRTMENRDSQNISIVENNTTTDNSHANEQKSKQRPSKEFFVSIDDYDADVNDENEKHSHRQSSSSNNNNKIHSQDKHLLERVEKLLAGDGTTTSSDVMSSQERQKKAVEKRTSPVEDDLDEKSLNTNQKKLPESRQLPSACSIEYDLSAVDRLLSERTPVNTQRNKSDTQLNRENQTKQPTDDNDEKKIIGDQRDRQFYERLNNYVQTGRFFSPEPSKQNTTITDDETHQSKSHPAPKIDNKDEELADLARRCEDLLARLHTQRHHAQMLENSTHHFDYYRRQTPPRSSSYESKYHHHRYHRSISPSPSPEAPSPMSLQQALELLRPEFISRSRQRARRIRLLREEREHNAEIDRERQRMLLFSCTNCCANPIKRTKSAPSQRRSISYIVPYDQSDSSRIPLSYRQMKEATKKKYDQLPEVKDRRFQNQMEEIRRRNVLRAKLFRTRLRQHVARHGRTDIDESLTMIET
jgi:hypothetical protein